MKFTAYFEQVEYAADPKAEPKISRYDVSMSFDQDPQTSVGHALFVAQATKLLAEQFPEASAKPYPPFFRGAREQRPKVTRLALLTSPEAPAYVIAKSLARRHPVSYGIDDLAVLRVWTDLFFNTTGAVWTSEGILVDDDSPALVELVTLAHAQLGNPLTEDQLRDIEWAEERVELLKPFERPTVHNHSHWGRSAKGYQPPGHIEPSYYSALLDVCRYFLSRPTWQCCNTDPAAWGLPDVYKDGTWREIALIDGRVQREAIAELYEHLKTGPFERCSPPTLVLEETFPADETLPAVWVPHQLQWEGPLLEMIERKLRERWKR